jgi:MoaA/NifB/PqqE/SkfB family radical SAM enzyme
MEPREPLRTTSSTSTPTPLLQQAARLSPVTDTGHPYLAPSAPGDASPGLPQPVFPQHPDLLAQEPVVPAWKNGHPPRRHWTAPLLMRAVRGWLAPYVKSRVLPGSFHPMIAYLFTEWKCNLDCHYCWAFDNRVKGMSEETARAAIDWLRDETTCRVLALMGGEVLLRPAFVHKVVYYAAKRGFWIYVPTNGRLLRPDVIDRLADAGVATVNLALDAVDERPGLPKALNPVRRNFEYLARRQYQYGYTVFFNINICRTNLDDVRALTEFARQHAIATDYHLNERPMMAQPQFAHLDENSTYINEEDWPRIDELLDWLIAKNAAGYKMVNSVARLNDMRSFMRGAIQQWNCRAGQNALIIRVDGTLAPCFPMYNDTRDWGRVGAPRFDPAELRPIKEACQPRCFSTLNHNLGYCYDDMRVIRWVLRQAAHGFQGVSRGFE